MPPEQRPEMEKLFRIGPNSNHALHGRDEFVNFGLVLLNRFTLGRFVRCGHRRPLVRRPAPSRPRPTVNFKTAEHFDFKKPATAPSIRGVPTGQRGFFTAAGLS